MSVAIPIPLLQHLPDVNVTPAVGVDEYALTWDNDTARFVLRAPTADLLATGATTGATSQAQAFTNGVVAPFNAPAADGTTAWQVRKADKTTSVLNVDTTNARVGIGTSAPATRLEVSSTTKTTSKITGSGDTFTYADIQLATPNTLSNNQVFQWAMAFRQDNYFSLGSRAFQIYANVSNGAAGTSGFLAPLAITETGNVILVAASSVLSNGRVGIGTTAPATRLDIDAGALTMKEMTAPTGVADKAMLYTKDNEAGKTQLCCKLGDNVEIVLATQA